jgi:hypothetical protein
VTKRQKTWGSPWSFALLIYSDNICKVGFTLEGQGFLWKHSINSVERKLLLSTELRLCLQRKPHPSRVSRVKPGLQMKAV